MASDSFNITKLEEKNVESSLEVPSVFMHSIDCIINKLRANSFSFSKKIQNDVYLPKVRGKSLYLSMLCPFKYQIIVVENFTIYI